jgi:hypothetical protein
MNKIPVGQIVSESYAFAFQRYFQILGILWVPFLLLGVAVYFVMVPFVGTMMNFMQYVAQHPQDKAVPFEQLQKMQQMSAGIWAVDLLELAVFAVITVGITKEVLGVRKGFRIAYLWFGLEELLVAAAYFAFAIMVFIFTFLAVLLGALLGTLLAVGLSALTHASGGALYAEGAGIGALIGIAVFAAFFYVAIRLCFFIAPVSVVEHDFGLFESWKLSRGNFWRIFAVLFLTWVPILVVVYAIDLAVAGQMIFLPIIKLAQALPKQGPEASAAVMKAMLSGFLQAWPYLTAVFVVTAPVLYGLIFSPGVFAYRALVPPKPAAAQG